MNIDIIVFSIYLFINVLLFIYFVMIKKNYIIMPFLVFEIMIGVFVVKIALSNLN